MRRKGKTVVLKSGYFGEDITVKVSDSVGMLQ